ncbi:GDSL esterase/lipase At4g16230-like [Andrographis paniculata]|uniref:GDSL esterase/lipase At4g16230-like n=1 Tax=Andrographis paniculata TaxID=175694 RepID=UPI0021E96A80|nr:GDSL esterase/lipase At4g16230-like [Andrographis paniculata]
MGHYRPLHCHCLIVLAFDSFIRLCTSSTAHTPVANFVFGDSLVDSGNNNYILSLSKADFVPNGIDFGGPTGRYTNGRTIVDIIGQEIGLSGFTPPYLAPTTAGPAILQGVNYASGGGGILNHTGKIFGGRINLDAQMDNFANTRQQIISTIGDAAAAKLFHSALFSVTIGSNDFINNYLTPAPCVDRVAQKQVPPESFVAAMISRFRTQLTRLYRMGGRRIVVANVGPIGCIPFQREINSAGAGAGPGCAAFPNQVAQLYNGQLRGLVQQLGTELPGSQFVYADVYRIVEDIIRNYSSYGFQNAAAPCCQLLLLSGVPAAPAGGPGPGLGLIDHINSLIPCGPASKVCPDRSKYVFWDPFHPTEAANAIIASRLFDGHHPYIFPVNIRRLTNE